MNGTHIAVSVSFPYHAAAAARRALYVAMAEVYCFAAVAAIFSAAEAESGASVIGNRAFAPAKGACVVGERDLFAGIAGIERGGVGLGWRIRSYVGRDRVPIYGWRGPCGRRAVPVHLRAVPVGSELRLERGHRHPPASTPNGESPPAGA